MHDISRLALTFAFIVLLLRKKLGIGWVMLAGSGALALLYGVPPASALRTALDVFTDGVTLKLLLALSFIRIFELVLRKRNILSEMMEAAKGLLRSKKAVIVSMPLLIGMLPSVGGAYFSAPMVEESTKDLKMSGEEKAFINYWYRHPWEFILPLYPGVLLASAVSGLKLSSLILANLACASVMAMTGFFLSMKGAGGLPETRLNKKGLWSFAPVASVLLLVVALGMELHTALMVVVAGLFIFYRYSPSEILEALRYGFSLEVFVLIGGVLLFKGMMETAGAVEGLSRTFSAWGIPLLPMLFMLPFLTGLLTGITIGFIGATFPLLSSMAGEGALYAMSFAFISGFMGVLLSPVHVCLVLTKEYFRADMGGIYRRLLPATAAVFAVAVAQYLVFK